MSRTNSVVEVFETHEQAEKAVKTLQEAGVDMKSLSIAAKKCTAKSMWLGTTTPGIG